MLMRNLSVTLKKNQMGTEPIMRVRLIKMVNLAGKDLSSHSIGRKLLKAPGSAIKSTV